MQESNNQAKGKTMKSSKRHFGIKLWNLVPCSVGFGEWESNGPVWVTKNSIKPNPKLDGLIHNQTGPSVSGTTIDGVEVKGMMPKS